MSGTAGYFDSPWPGEDAGPQRRQVALFGDEPRVSGTWTLVTRPAMVATMVVLRAPGEVYLLCHTGGDAAISWVEQIDPVTLEMRRRSPDLPGGKTWPGGVAAHANGSLYVAFGRHVHRLSPDLEVLASAEMPRDRPYNSFVILPDGSLVTKDFGGALPGESSDVVSATTQLVILEPDQLTTITTLELPEGSVARLSADDNDIYVVGTHSLMRCRYEPSTRRCVRDETLTVPYRRDGEGYGWDAVIADGSAWFLNNGEGSQNYDGSLLGKGEATRGQVIVRVELTTGALVRYNVNDQPGAVVANPPAVDCVRGIVVGYDSGHRVVTAWDYRSEPARHLWTRTIGHGGHPIVLEVLGAVVLGDYDPATHDEALMVIDVTSGDQLARVSGVSPIQSVLFGARGFDHDIYVCTFLSVSRVST